MNYTERLRRLAINDEHWAEHDVDGADVAGGELDAKTLALVRLAALVAVGGAVPSYGAQADAAVSAGATVAEIVDVLVGVVRIVGLSVRRCGGPQTGVGVGVRNRRCLRVLVGRVSPSYQPRRPVVVACCTASLRLETPSFR